MIFCAPVEKPNHYQQKFQEGNVEMAAPKFDPKEMEVSCLR
jgi:hypothetical protein